MSSNARPRSAAEANDGATGLVRKTTTRRNTRWWSTMANVLCFPSRCCTNASPGPDETTGGDVAAAEGTVRRKAAAEKRWWKKAIGLAPSRGVVNVSLDAIRSTEGVTSNDVAVASNDVAVTSNDVAVALNDVAVASNDVAAAAEKQAVGVVTSSGADDSDEDDAPRRRRKHRDDPYASESKVKRVIVPRGDLKAERVLLLTRTAGEGVRRRANSVGRSSPSAAWKPRADVFLADTLAAVDTIRARLADPSVRHRCRPAVPVPENADDVQGPLLYVERAAWKPRVSAFRTQNAFFQYQSRRPTLFIVLNA